MKSRSHDPCSMCKFAGDLATEVREAVASRALSHRKECGDSRIRGRFESKLRTLIVRGFRNGSQVPDTQLSKILARGILYCGDIQHLVWELWLDSHQDL